MHLVIHTTFSLVFKDWNLAIQFNRKLSTCSLCTCFRGEVGKTAIFLLHVLKRLEIRSDRRFRFFYIKYIWKKIKAVQNCDLRSVNFYIWKKILCLLHAHSGETKFYTIDEKHILTPKKIWTHFAGSIKTYSRF